MDFTKNPTLQRLAKEMKQMYRKVMTVKCTRCHHEWTEYRETQDAEPKEYCGCCCAPGKFLK